MNDYSVSIWNSLSVWTRFGILWSNIDSKKPYFIIFRFISLLQASLSIVENISASKFNQNYLFLIKAEFSIFFLKPICSHLWIALGGIAAYFCVIFLIVIASIHQSSNESIKDSKCAKLLSSITTFHSEVLFYLFNRCFCELLTSLEDNRSEISQKGIKFSIVLVLLCLNAVLTFYKIMFCYSRVRSKNFISRKGSLHLMGIATLKFLLPIIQVLNTYSKDQADSKYEILSIIVSLLVSLSILLYTFLRLPEYSLVMTKMHIIFHSIFVGVCVGQLVGNLIPSHEVILNLIFLLVPFWIKLNLNIFELLIERLKFFPEKILNHYHGLHLEVIYKELDYCSIFHDNTQRFSFSFFEQKWLCNHLFQELSSKLPLENKNMDAIKMSKIYLKGYYQNLLTINPKSVLVSLSYAKLIVNSFSVFSKAYHLCFQASKQRISVPDNISIYLILNKIQSALNHIKNQSNEINGTSKEMYKMFKYDTEFQDLKSQLIKYIEHSISYWKILQQEKPDILNLIKQAKGLEKQNQVIEATWKRYEPGFSEKFSLSHFLYGIFQAQFLNKPWEGAQHIEKYNSFIKNRGYDSCVKTHFSHEYGTIMVSGNRKNLGEIVYCSDMISEIFVIEKKSLLGKNVNAIMPKFFQEKHSLFLLNQYESGENKILWKKTLLYGKDSNHNIFPMSLLLGIHLDFKKGIIYTAIIKKIKDKNEYILFKDDGLIDETSASIRQICGIEPDKKMKINSICQDFDFEKYKQSLMNNKQEENFQDKKILIKIKDSGEFKKQYVKAGMDRESENHNLQDIFTFIINIKRYSYCNEVLNVMILEFKSDTQSKIRDISTRLDSTKTDQKTFKNFAGRKMLRLTSRGNWPHRAHVYDSKRRNIGYNDKKSTLGDPNLGLMHSLDHEAIVSPSSNRLESEKMTLRTVGSMKDDTFNVSVPIIRNKTIDNLYRTLSKPHLNRFKNVIINLLIIILIIFLSMIILQYMDLEVSIEGLKFEIGAIRTTYDRLTSLSLISWYANAYKIRLNGLLKVNISDLDRFKLRIRIKRDDLKMLNDDLIDIITTGQDYQQQRFFQRDIRITYENASNTIDQRKVNNFEAIHLFVEKLTRFDATPHSLLLQNGNPDLQFVKNNLMNDLLISSEEIVESVQNTFLADIEYKKMRMSTIFFMNIAIGWLNIILVLGVFCFIHRLNVRLAKALTSIHPQNIDLMISKLSFFNDLLRKKEKFLPKALNNFHQHYSLSSAERLRNLRLSNSSYRMNSFLIAKMKQCFILILLICCISVVSSIRFISSRTLLEEALLTNDQIIFVSKTRHMVILSFATLVELVENLNTTKIRNQSLDKQLILNVDAIPAANVVFEKLIDVDGQILDSEIETLLKGEPCSLVINFAGSLNDINCPVVTQNETIGILAVYSYSHEELYSLSEKMMGNLTFENSKEMAAYITNFTSPRINTLNGSFMFLIDFLSKKIDGQISHLLEDAKSKLIWQIILIILLSIVIIWFLIRKIFDESTMRALLKTVPFGEINRNKLIKQFIKDLYKERINVFD